MTQLSLVATVSALLLGEVTSVIGADGLDTWTNRSSGTTNQLLAITHGESLSGTSFFIACGAAGTLLASSDGTNWMMQNLGSTNTLAGVAEGNGKFVVVGWGYGSNFAAASTNATTWITTISGGAGLRSVTFGQGQFAVGAVVGITTSSNGVTWTGHFVVGESYFRAIAYGENRFVVIGDYVSAVCTNVNDWRYADVREQVSGRGQAIAYGKGTFVKINQNILSTSAEGLNWTNRFAGQRNLYGIGFGAGTFVAVGDSGTIVTSMDGIHWRQRSSGIKTSLRAATYGEGSFVVVGDNGTIIQSGPVVNLSGRKIPGAGYELSLTGPIGKGYRIQVSSDLRTWADFVGFTSVQETTTIADLSASQLSMRFYRAVSP